VGERRVGHAAVVDQPRDRLAAARAAKRVRAEQRNRLRALKQAYFDLFEKYLRLAELDDTPAAEIRAARSAAWAAHHEFANEQARVDRQVARARGAARS
jgi:hypothetical protein